ncbi:MAG: hypothetical protein RBQ97_08020, partial [Acholeplasma sp.]|nr:hypothetical protein [Acholeplasma sp.]
MEKKKSNTKILWYAIAIGVIILFLLMLLSSVLGVGERLRNISMYIEYGFYAVVLFLVYFLLIRPVNIILFSPSFSVETTLDKDSKKNYLVYKKVSKRLLEQKFISEELKNELSDAIKDREQLKIILNKLFDKQ